MKVEERSVIDLRRLVRKREVYLACEPEVIVEGVGLLERILSWVRACYARRRQERPGGAEEKASRLAVEGREHWR